MGCLNYRILIFQRVIGLQIDYCCPPYLKESNKILRSDGGMANMGRKQPLEGTNGLTAEADEAKNMSRSSDRAESLLYKELASAKFIPLAAQAALTKSGGCNAWQLAEVEMAPLRVVLFHNGAFSPAQLALARPSKSSGWWVDWGSGALQSEG